MMMIVRTAYLSSSIQAILTASPQARSALPRSRPT